MDGQTKTAPRVVNGIDVDALFGLIDDVKTDPAKGQTRWRVATAWQGHTRSRATVEGFGMGGDQVSRRFTIVSVILTAAVAFLVGAIVAGGLGRPSLDAGPANTRDARPRSRRTSCPLGTSYSVTSRPSSTPVRFIIGGSMNR